MSSHFYFQENSQKSQCNRSGDWEYTVIFLCVKNCRLKCDVWQSALSSCKTKPFRLYQMRCEDRLSAISQLINPLFARTISFTFDYIKSCQLIFNLFEIVTCTVCRVVADSPSANISISCVSCEFKAKFNITRYSKSIAIQDSRRQQ